MIKKLVEGSACTEVVILTIACYGNELTNSILMTCINFGIYASTLSLLVFVFLIIFPGRPRVVFRIKHDEQR